MRSSIARRLVELVATALVIGCSAQPAGGGNGSGAGGEWLALRSGQCAPVARSFVDCNGSVQNLTTNSLRDVEVLVLWSDVSGRLQRTDSALIAYNPILAGQTSPWQVIGTANPALTTYTIAFKQLLGGSIAHRDERVATSLTTSPAPATATAVPTPSAISGPHARLGETVALPNGLRLTAVELRDEPATRYLTSSIGNRLVTVVIRVENRAASGSVDVHPGVFFLRDESGKVHGSVAAGSALPNAFVFTRLGPGMTITGTVTFEVPVAQTQFQVSGLGATLELY